MVLTMAKGHKFDASETADFHWRSFFDFCRYELAAGGPDPHMRLLGHMSRKATEQERLWRIGCYVAVYNIPSAELIWSYWSAKDALNRRNDIEDWMKENWKGLRLRRERRTVKSPAKLSEFLQGYAKWSSSAELSDIKTYEDLWESVNGIKYIGRYAALKLSEALWRYAGLGQPLNDLRSQGAWSLKLSLSYLYPEKAGELTAKETQDTLNTMDALGKKTKNRLAERFKIPIDMYNTEVLLCDYKQSWDGRQYPGRSQDSELDYNRAAAEYWAGDYITTMFKARSSLFPPEVLGEKQGWPGVRKPLTQLLKSYKYQWTDLRYDYLRSTVLAQPIQRVKDDEAESNITRLVRARTFTQGS